MIFLAGRLVEGLAPETGADPQEARRVRGELDGLRAIVESHFGYVAARLGAATT